MGTVVALAGRLIDRPGDAGSRFPPENVPFVREEIRALLKRLDAKLLVCSAACGADLLALGVAEDMGISCQIVLPVAKELFREVSVAGRPGDWDQEFDRKTELAAKRGELLTLLPQGPETQWFLDANTRILDEAARASENTGAEAVAVVVWEGSRGESDVTGQLAVQARRRGMAVFEIATLRVERA